MSIRTRRLLVRATPWLVGLLIFFIPTLVDRYFTQPQIEKPAMVRAMALSRGKDGAGSTPDQRRESERELQRSMEQSYRVYLASGAFAFAVAIVLMLFQARLEKGLRAAA